MILVCLVFRIKYDTNKREEKYYVSSGAASSKAIYACEGCRQASLPVHPPPAAAQFSMSLVLRHHWNIIYESVWNSGKLLWPTCASRIAIQCYKKENIKTVETLLWSLTITLIPSPRLPLQLCRERIRRSFLVEHLTGHLKTHKTKYPSIFDFRTSILDKKKSMTMS